MLSSGKDQLISTSRGMGEEAADSSGMKGTGQDKWDWFVKKAWLMLEDTGE